MGNAHLPSVVLEKLTLSSNGSSLSALSGSLIIGQSVICRVVRHCRVLIESGKQVIYAQLDKLRLSNTVIANIAQGKCPVGSINSARGPKPIAKPKLVIPVHTCEASNFE